MSYRQYMDTNPPSTSPPTFSPTGMPTFFSPSPTSTSSHIIFGSVLNSNVTSGDILVDALFVILLLSFVTIGYIYRRNLVDNCLSLISNNHVNNSLNSGGSRISSNRPISRSDMIPLSLDSTHGSGSSSMLPQVKSLMQKSMNTFVHPSNITNQNNFERHQEIYNVMRSSPVVATSNPPLFFPPSPSQRNTLMDTRNKVKSIQVDDEVTITV